MTTVSLESVLISCVRFNLESALIGSSTRWITYYNATSTLFNENHEQVNIETCIAVVHNFFGAWLSNDGLGWVTMHLKWGKLV